MQETYMADSYTDMKRVFRLNPLYCLPMILLFSFTYMSTLRWMYDRFTIVDTYYSHGFLVPLIAAFLIWQKKDRLEKIPIVYSWWGLLIIVLALLLHLLGTIFYVFFTSGLSILILVFGISMFVFGPQRTKEVRFPLAFLLFMIPLPSSVINVVSLPMKMQVASLGAGLVKFLGVPIFQSGFFIDTAKGTLLVDDPCSGIRSLISFMALGALAGYISHASAKSKLVIFASSILIAMATNILRVSFLILATNHYGTNFVQPESWVHNVSGYVAFVVGGILLFQVKGRLDGKN